MANMTTQEILQGVKDWTTGKLNSNDAKNGYYVCSTDANVAAKTISATNYVLGNGGSIKVKMTNANTAGNATLNINSTGAKALYYDGERASANNSWEAGETVEVYYDGTSFYANNVAGGSGSGDGAFDVSAKYPTSGVDGGNTYTLEGALAVLNANLSASKKKGGMSIKFIHSSDNKYVQYRLMASSFSTIESDWQGVDDEPTAGSENSVKSSGVRTAIEVVGENLATEVVSTVDNPTIEPGSVQKDGTILEIASYGYVAPITLESGNTILVNKGAAMYYGQNVAVIYECTSEGVFIKPIIVGSGEFEVAEYTNFTKDTKYIGICGYAVNLKYIILSYAKSVSEKVFVKNCILSESFTFTSITRNDDGDVIAANIVYPDGKTGSLTITRDSEGNVSSEVAVYNGTSYTLSITRDSDGNVSSTNLS